MRRGGSTWATVGLVLLGAIAVVLSWAAIDSTQGRAGEAAPVSATDGSPESASPPADEHDGDRPGQEQSDDPDQASSDDDPPDGATGGEEGAGVQAGIEPPLLMAGRIFAYRAVVGSCSGGATFDRSSSAGARWHGVHTPSPAVLSLTGRGRSVRLIGADESCDLKVWATHDEGRTWSAPTPPEGVFVRIPDNPGALLTPTGVVPNPCPATGEGPVSVSGVSGTSAAVLCTTGDVAVTSDGGRHWVTRSPVVGGVAMMFDTSNVGWSLRVNSGQCPAYQVMKTQDRALTWQTSGCVAGESADASAGRASISFTDHDHGMAVVGRVTYLTNDSGQTWKRAN